MINQQQLRPAARLLSPCLRASQVTLLKPEPRPEIVEMKEICEAVRAPQGTRRGRAPSIIMFECFLHNKKLD